MIILLSPTKQMDFFSPVPEQLVSSSFEDNQTPLYETYACKLNNLLKDYSDGELKTLMKISSSLAQDTGKKICLFGKEDNPRKAALFAYSGTVFQEINPAGFSPEDLLFARDHLRILSGLYGILTPLDRIQPYRLEMKAPLKVPGEEGGLVSFWKKKVSANLNKESLILNLASAEYSRVLDKSLLKGRILSITFKEEKNGRLRTVGMYAKKARGMMIRRIIQEKITDPEELKKGDNGGYRFRDEESLPDHWVFVRIDRP